MTGSSAYDSADDRPNTAVSDRTPTPVGANDGSFDDTARVEGGFRPAPQSPPDPNFGRPLRSTQND